MSLSPNEIRQAEFERSRRGYDAEQVRAFLEEAALSLEACRNDAMTIERRFRAAAARVQELTAESAERVMANPVRAVGDAETRADDIGRAILMAQRAADTALEEARREAEEIRSAARRSARDEYEAERQRIIGELRELEARRADLERRVIERTGNLRADQDRLREVADSLRQLAERHFGVTVADPVEAVSDDDAPDLGATAEHPMPTGPADEADMEVMAHTDSAVPEPEQQALDETEVDRAVADTGGEAVIRFDDDGEMRFGEGRNVDDGLPDAPGR